MQRQMVYSSDKDAQFINEIQREFEVILQDTTEYAKMFTYRSNNPGGFTKEDVERIIPKIKSVMPDLIEIRAVTRMTELDYFIVGLIASSQESLARSQRGEAA